MQNNEHKCFGDPHVHQTGEMCDGCDRHFSCRDERVARQRAELIANPKKLWVGVDHGVGPSWTAVHINKPIQGTAADMLGKTAVGRLHSTVPECQTLPRATPSDPLADAALLGDLLCKGLGVPQHLLDGNWTVTGEQLYRAEQESRNMSRKFLEDIKTCMKAKEMAMGECRLYGDPKFEQTVELCDNCSRQFQCQEARKNRRQLGVPNKVDTKTVYDSVKDKFVPLAAAALTRVARPNAVWTTRLLVRLSHNFDTPSDQDLANADTVVRVMKSREHVTGAWLELVPHQPPPMPIEQLDPTQQPDLLARLAAVIGLPIDGFATWEGVVGFVEAEFNRLTTSRDRALKTAEQLDLDYQHERKRANQAADHAGNTQNRSNERAHEFAAIVADLTIANKLLRDELKKKR